MYDEQADIIEAPIVTSNPTGSATLEPIITPCSEQLTLRADLNQLITPLMYFSQIIFIISAGLQYFRHALLSPRINGTECTECRGAVTTAADYNYKSALEYQASALWSNYYSSW